MSTAEAPAPPKFEHLFTPEELQAANQHVFRAVGGLLWFERLHHEELIAAGAVVELAGRKLFHGPKFIATAMEIGARQAAARRKRAAA